MAKGVKKVRYISGKVDEKNSKPTQIVALPNETIIFGVREWEDGTTEADKQKGVTWIWQTANRIKIIGQVHASYGQNFKFTIPPNLCGAYGYYIEASLTGKTDVRKTGVTVVGHCPPKITNAHWAHALKGSAITEANSYGGAIFLELKTEGLNGYSKLQVEIYKQGNDKPITTISTSRVTDGKASTEVKTAFWSSNFQQASESFFIKVKNPNNGKHIPDNNKNEKHAPLTLKNNFAFVMPAAPTNKSPAKVGSANTNYSKPLPCRYNKIIITDKDSNKDVFETEIYDSVKHPVILPYETIAGSSESSKKELKLSYKKFENKQCFSKTSHKKEVEIFIDGKKQKIEVINGENVTVDLIAKANTILLRSNPELFFITPDAITHYQIIAKTCAQPAGFLNVNVFPNVEREVAFVLTLFKSFNAEVNQNFLQEKS